MRKKLGAIFLIGMFLFLRLYRIGERVDFSMDQGRDAIRALEIWKNKEITLIGPTASPKVEGRNFFNGPLPYYSIVGVMVAAGWEPLGAAVVLVLLNLAAMGILWQTIRITIGEEAAWLGAAWWTFWPITIEYSSFLWNPNFLLILMPIYLWLLSKERWWWGGVMAGICLQYHLQMVPVVGATAIWLTTGKTGWKNWGWWGVGVLAGYSPLLVFDLRNNFYNFRTMMGWLANGGDDKFGLQPYYFLAWIPIVILILSKYLAKYRLVAVGGLMVLAVMATAGVINQKQAYGMPKNWNYLDLVKAEKIIGEENRGKSFNIVNLLSGDTRFYSLRYLLIRDGLAINGVEDYGNQENLWVVSDKGEEEIINYPVWEINSMKTRKIQQDWKINERVLLYLVTR